MSSMAALKGIVHGFLVRANNSKSLGGLVCFESSEGLHANFLQSNALCQSAACVLWYYNCYSNTSLKIFNDMVSGCKPFVCYETLNCVELSIRHMSVSVNNFTVTILIRA